MSGQATSPVGRRLSRAVESAAVGDRLSLVPRRSVPAPRTPFVALIVIVLAGGVVGLLMFNTQMQQRSFEMTRLQGQATALSAKVQALLVNQQRLDDPQHLAQVARRLGMVVPANPTFIRLDNGKVLGVPVMSSTGDAMQIRQPATPKPAHLAPPPRIVHVAAKPPASTTTKKSVSSGAASTSTRSTQGRNGKTGTHR